jgi:amino acid adenylation domain-containing protein
MGEGSLSIHCAQLLQERNYQLLGIISPDPQVEQWAVEHRIFHATPDHNLFKVLAGQPFDYLFSIVNHVILSKDVLSLPQQLIINYHDSPLPQYAGLYASTWALLHQEKQHAITWHQVSSGIDEGDILKQAWIDIVPDETAFTLNAKCFEAAIDSFTELIDELATDTATFTKQNLANRSYYSRTRKPEMGVQFQWHKPADHLDALVRSLHFEPFPNPLTLPKLIVEANHKQTLLAISELTILDRPSSQPPGTITAIRADAVEVTTATNDIALRQLLTLQGQPLSISTFVAQFGLQVGDRFPDLDADAAQQIDSLDSQLAKHEKFWVNQLANLQPLNLLSFVQKATCSSEPPIYAMLQAEIPAGILHPLDKTRDKQQLSQALMAGFVSYLACASRTFCFDLGFRDSGLQSDVVDLSLFFASQVPCRISLNPDQSFEAVLQTVTGQVEQLKKAQTYSADLVARYPVLAVKPELKSQHFFSISVHFTSQNLSQSVDSFLPETLGRELTLVISETESTCCWIYNQNVLDSEKIQVINHQFFTFLQELISSPDRSLQQHSSVSLQSSLGGLSEAEHHQILMEWNATEREYDRELRLHDLFEAQVDRTPDAVAVVFAGESLTYAALNQRANQLAHHLQKLGVTPETPVGICVERSIEMVVGLFAILKAGGAYVPLDPTYPADRLAHILADAQMSVVLTQAKLQALLPSHLTSICLDTDWQSIAAEPQDNPVSPVTSENLAYIIYTSGSTGKPKGVLIEHRGAVNTVLDINSRFGVQASDRVLSVCSLNFDLSVYDLFGLLAAGGTVILPQPSIAPDPKHWIDLMVQEQVTIWNSAPPVMQMFSGHLADMECRLPRSLRLLLLSGDWISLTLPSLIRELKIGEEPIEIISLGGATEASIWSIFYPIESINPAWKSIPYGKPLANQRFYVLDEQLNPVPIGTIGELFIGGDGVARGYLNRPELNATKFIPDPFSDNPSAHLYRTGDLGRYLPDGNIEFLGRIDHQVKIRGFRVELGEIEAVLLQCSGIREAALLAREVSPGDQQIVAYLVADRTESEPSLEVIRHFLKEKLPDYMIPAAFVWLSSLPLTPNGKLDRKALPDPDLSHASRSNPTLTAPRNAIEQQLVQIWETFLQVQPIGIQDNFFELGGNSLVAVRLWSTVEKTFNQTLPLVTLFQQPTIEQLAERLRQSHIPSESDQSLLCPSLVLIQPDRSQGKKPPLFCIHVLGRGLKFYRSLVRHLDPEQPIYGLSTHIAGESFPSNQAEDLAVHYIKQIQALQPEGPYLLAGVSYGGLVAYEMARQLKLQGQDVALLALLDSRSPNANIPISKSEKLTKHWQHFSDIGWSYGAQKLKERVVGQAYHWQEYLRQRILQLGIEVCQHTRQPLPAALQDFFHEQQNLESMEAYIPQVYLGHVTLFKAAQPSINPEYGLDPNLGWHEWAAGGLEIYEIPGTHLGMLQEPFVQVLGEKLQYCITRSIGG